MIAEYKTIFIKTKVLSDRITPVLDNLFREQSPNDVRYEPNGGGVDILLRAIDFRKLDNDVKTLQSEYKQQEINNMLDDIVSSIAAIKSYGIKGKKRLYVGYNNERKVKNRKQKVNQRK